MNTSSTDPVPPYQPHPGPTLFTDPANERAYDTALKKWRRRYVQERMFRSGGNAEMLTAAVLQEVEASAKAAAANEVWGNGKEAEKPTMQISWEPCRKPNLTREQVVRAVFITIGISLFLAWMGFI